MCQVWKWSSSTFVPWSLSKTACEATDLFCIMQKWNLKCHIFQVCLLYLIWYEALSLYFLHKIWIFETSFGFPWQWTQSNRMWSLNLLFKSLSFHYKLHKFMLREIKTTHAVVNRCSVRLFLGWWIQFPVLSIYKAQIFLVWSNTLICYSEDLGVAAKFHPSTIAKDNLLTVFSLHST